jgi:ABC-type bacteriocin/lantibiotic exporter with double-glycine peptidase domain
MGRPAMLVLDEPTVHLAQDVTDRLLDNLRTLDRSPTVVLITHEPTVMQTADRLYELHHGRISGERRLRPERMGAV